LPYVIIKEMKKNKRNLILTFDLISLYVNLRVVILAMIAGMIYLWMIPLYSPSVYSEKSSADFGNIMAKNTTLDVLFDFHLSPKSDRCLEDQKIKRDSLLCDQPLQPEINEEIVVKIEPSLTVQASINKKAASNTAARQIHRVIIQKRTCPEENSHPAKSKQGKGKHVDEDCCPDPDEYPNPACSYGSSDNAILLVRK
jgi:hypothetical protein